VTVEAATLGTYKRKPIGIFIISLAANQEGAHANARGPLRPEGGT